VEADIEGDMESEGESDLAALEEIEGDGEWLQVVVALGEGLYGSGQFSILYPSR